MEQKTVNISILQMNSNVGDVEANCNKVEEIIERDLKTDTDLIVLPEVWTVGWDCKRFKDSAQDLKNSSVIDFLVKIAQKYNTNIIGGSFITKDVDKYYNTCPVINRTGKLICTYNKMHLYSYYGCDEGKYISEGTNPVVVNIENVNYGLTICYDIRFPEIYRAYRHSGADVLINCAAWGSKKPIPWEMMTKSRAIENQCYMIALTQCGPINENEYNLGESRVIDYKGEEILSIMEGENLKTCAINLDEMYEFRSKCDILKDIKTVYEVKTLCIK